MISLEPFPPSIAKAWRRVQPKPHHGIAIPLSSIYSQKSCGIGEFDDLRFLIDFCSRVGFDIIQLLPLNDSYQDISPYNPISSCALNPVYLSLKEFPFPPPMLIQKKPVETRINYSLVLQEKKKWLKHYYLETHEHFKKQASYKQFCENNSWLVPYALFLALKEKKKNSSWLSWEDRYRWDRTAHLFSLTQEFEKEIDFHTWVQYLCFEQLKAVKEYAKQKGVLILGDLPILFSIESADVWENPEFFDLNLAAGSPPDQYSKEGQYWGFPLYRWDNIQKNHYSIWQRRLKTMSSFYDLYRIDHAVGFYRIFATHRGGRIQDGFFVPSDELSWQKQGETILKTLFDMSPLLPIAEDLGTVPPLVRESLTRLGICGTKVMRWERLWNKDKTYILPSQYPPLSLTTLSTHDSLTLAEWWRDCEEEAKQLAQSKNWVYTPLLDKEKRLQLLKDSHQSGSLFHINFLQEYLALFDELSFNDIDQDRINDPSQLKESNWTYRYKISMEELLSHDKLQEVMRGLKK